MFKVAVIQLNATNNLQANIDAVKAQVIKAADMGANLICLPENALFMYYNNTELEANGYVEDEHPGIIVLSHLAKEKNILLLVGSVAIRTDNQERFHNRSLLLDREGNIIGRYDKLHLFDVDVKGDRSYRESDTIHPGTEAVVVETDIATIGLSICYDIRFPNLYRKLAKSGAEILMVPAAFTVKTGEAHWEVLLRARAIENAAYVIAPAQTGSHPGNRKTYGHSMIVDPWGKVIAQLDQEVGILMAEIDTDEVHKVRGDLPSLTHDREFSVTKTKGQ